MPKHTFRKNLKSKKKSARSDSGAFERFPGERFGDLLTPEFYCRPYEKIKREDIQEIYAVGEKKSYNCVTRAIALYSSIKNNETILPASNIILFENHLKKKLNLQETDWMQQEAIPSFITAHSPEVSNYIVKGKINPKAGSSCLEVGRYFGHFFNIANIDGIWMVFDAFYNYLGKDFYRWIGNTVDMEKVYLGFKLYYSRSESASC